MEILKPASYEMEQMDNHGPSAYGADRRDDNAHAQPDFPAGPAFRFDGELFRQLFPPDHRCDGAVSPAEGIAEYIQAGHNLVTTAPDNVLGRPPENPPRGGVPQDDFLLRVDRERSVRRRCKALLQIGQCHGMSFTPFGQPSVSAR